MVDLKKIFKILKHLKQPYFLRNLILNKLISIVFQKVKGQNIFEDDWDNLIILDACRYDCFKYFYDKNYLGGKISKRKSLGAHTVSFLQNNFTEKYYDNLIYITANPFVNKNLKDKVYKIIPVWKDGWNEENHTVLPEVMFQKTIETLLKHPHCKFIIHFMQPHYPYIGYDLSDNSVEILRELVSENKEIKFNQTIKKSFFNLYSSRIYSIIPRERQLKLYLNNLKLTLPVVNKLVNSLPGKSVVTSDHGEAFGERIHPIIPFRFFGHKKGIKMPELIEVPWLAIDVPLKNKILQKEFREKKEIDIGIQKIKNKLISSE